MPELVMIGAVAGRIQQEIQQKKPFRHPEEEAFLNIERTADVLMQRLLDVLRPHELTATQYNVLRILRGAGEDGANCKDIGGRLITRDPDITRLLDRLEKRGLLRRDRSGRDRRFVTARITDTGLSLLAALDRPVLNVCLQALRGVTRERLSVLIDVLEEIRSAQ